MAPTSDVEAVVDQVTSAAGAEVIQRLGHKGGIATTLSEPPAVANILSGTVRAEDVAARGVAKPREQYEMVGPTPQHGGKRIAATGEEARLSDNLGPKRGTSTTYLAGRIKAKVAKGDERGIGRLGLDGCSL